MGEQSMVVNHREMFRDMYIKKFDSIMTRENGKLTYTTYLDKPKDEYYIHLKIPSEVVPRFYYDVVIKFFTKDKVPSIDPNLNKYDVQFYSNDPMFVFTFIYAYKKNKLFIEELAPKMSKIALRDPAKERNPKNLVGYCKSIYFAYLGMQSRGLFLKATYTTYGKPYKIREVLNNIDDADLKIDDRKEKGEQVRKQNSKKEKDAATTKEDNRRGSSANIMTTTTKNVKTTSTVNRSASTKRSKIIGKNK